jgi:hypothetical protein
MSMTPVIAQYIPELGQLLRTFNIRYELAGRTFEVPMKAVSWTQAESIMAAIKDNGMVHSELVEIET